LLVILVVVPEHKMVPLLINVQRVTELVRFAESPIRYWDKCRLPPLAPHVRAKDKPSPINAKLAMVMEPPWVKK
jgi:hypothetical protein